jgi:hypothetical protein
MNKAHFEEGDRNLVVVEEADGFKQAEALADNFLSEVTSMDECGAMHRRIEVSGIRREGKYYFDVVVTA